MVALFTVVVVDRLTSFAYVRLLILGINKYMLILQGLVLRCVSETSLIIIMGHKIEREKLRQLFVVTDEKYTPFPRTPWCMYRPYIFFIYVMGRWHGQYCADWPYTLSTADGSCDDIFLFVSSFRCVETDRVRSVRGYYVADETGVLQETNHRLP